MGMAKRTPGTLRNYMPRYEARYAYSPCTRIYLYLRNFCVTQTLRKATQTKVRNFATFA